MTARVYKIGDEIEFNYIKGKLIAIEPSVYIPKGDALTGLHSALSRIRIKKSDCEESCALGSFKEFKEGLRIENREGELVLILEEQEKTR